MIKKLLVIAVTFVVTFILFTAITDIVCRYNGFYTEEG